VYKSLASISNIIKKDNFKRLERTRRAELWWLMSVFLVTWEAEIGRISVGGQSGQIVHKAPSSK
jgi:hypothetical protein